MFHESMSEGAPKRDVPQKIEPPKERMLENGFRLIEQGANFGRGKVNIVQVVPPTIPESARSTTRKQIFIPGYRPSWVDQPKELENDLIALAELNQEYGRDVVTVGVAFIGDRNHSGDLATNTKPGVAITVSQYERAQDVVASLENLVDGNNAEVIAHSLGGTVALAANDLGLPVDTIGLFNAAGLYKESNEALALHKIPERIKEPLKASYHKVKTILERRKERRRGDLPGRSILDRVLESRASNYAAYRSLTHAYLTDLEGKRVIIGNSENDRLYPRKQVRNVLQSRGVVSEANVNLVDLSWENHGLGKQGKSQRRERLREIVKVMQEDRL